MGWKDIKPLNALYEGMSLAKPPVDPIVIRHKELSMHDDTTLWGFFGFKVERKSRPGNNMPVLIAKIDQNKPCVFYHDQNASQYAIIPDCEHNRKTILDNAKRVPFVLVECPDALKKAFNKAKAIPEESPIPEEKKKSKGDSFNYNPEAEAQLRKDGETIV
jgi:hypothetical protein